MNIAQNPSERRTAGSLMPLILLFFFFSGVSGLIYEVIWTRLLLTVFGATLYAVSTVLAAFMGGLALGSLIGGRTADRIRHPLRLYGILEIVIAILAVSVPYLLKICDPIYQAVYAAGDASFMKLSLIRFGLTFCVLLIPTTCMGATLPVLSRFLVRKSERLGARIGGLYAVNTFGAVSGAFLAGFILIAHLGVTETIYLAAAISALVGVGSLIVSAVVEKEALACAIGENNEESDGSVGSVGSVGSYISAPEQIPAWLARLVLISYAASGFVALAYQVFWTRALVFRFEYLKNTTYSFSAMLTVFLIGLAVGSSLMSALIDRQRDPVRLYGLIQILTGLSGAFSLLMLLHYVGLMQIGEPLNPETYSFNWLLAVINVFMRTAATIGLPTFLMGMAFPVVARICIRHLESVGAGTGRIYALNTLGAILGSFAAGFILIPLLGLAKGILVLGMANVVIGAIVLAANPQGTPRQKMAWAVISLAAFGLFFLRLPEKFYFQELNPMEQMVAYEEGPLATVAVVENLIGHRTIYVDNVGVAGTDRILLTDQKSLAHVPMLFLKDPKSALTVGFGSGGASYSYTLYPELEKIDCIEICKTVPQVADTLKDSNHGVLDSPRDPRYRVLFDDARSYLRFTKARYDIIATDCTDLRYKSNANLYDVEYFRLCKEALTEKGMVVVWMPLGGMAPKVFATALKTFADVFPDMTIWYMNNEPTHYLLLLGTREGNPLKIDLDIMLQRINRPEIQKDLAEVSLQQPEKILSCFLEAAPALKADFANAPLNSEDFPHLEFESPKYGYSDEAMLTNLDLLRKRRTPVQPYLEGAEKHADLMARLVKFEQAIDPILAGHSRLRLLEIKDACLEYMKAAAICPEDLSIQHALTFEDILKRAERSSSDTWAWVTLGETDLLKKDYAAAANRFAHVLDVTDRKNKEQIAFARQSVIGLARCYAATGEKARAMEVLETNKAIMEGNPDYKALREELGG